MEKDQYGLQETLRPMIGKKYSLGVVLLAVFLVTAKGVDIKLAESSNFIATNRPLTILFDVEFVSGMFSAFEATNGTPVVRSSGTPDTYRVVLHENGFYVYRLLSRTFLTNGNLTEISPETRVFGRYKDSWWLAHHEQLITTECESAVGLVAAAIAALQKEPKDPLAIAMFNEGLFAYAIQAHGLSFVEPESVKFVGDIVRARQSDGKGIVGKILDLGTKSSKAVVMDYVPREGGIQRMLFLYAAGTNLQSPVFGMPTSILSLRQTNEAWSSEVLYTIRSVETLDSTTIVGGGDPRLMFKFPEGAFLISNNAPYKVLDGKLVPAPEILNSAKRTFETNQEAAGRPWVIRIGLVTLALVMLWPIIRAARKRPHKQNN